MEWIERLEGSLVGIDTVPFIYFFEDHKNYYHLLDPFFEAIDNGEFKAVTSTITLLEVLVHPLKKKDSWLVNQYKEILFHSERISTIPLFPHIAETAAQLRADYIMSTPDSIQLATAICSEANFFLSNDKRLPKLSEIEVLILDEIREK